MYIKKSHVEKSLINSGFSKKSLPLYTLKIIKRLKYANDIKTKQLLCRLFIDKLCCIFKIPKCKVILYEKKRKKIRGRRPNGINESLILMALHTHYHNLKKDKIEVWALSENGRKLTWYQILYLLLHEFVHHYDIHRLKIDVDHDKGFEIRHKKLWLMATKNKGKKL